MVGKEIAKKLIVLSIDAALVTASLVISYALRFNTSDLGPHWGQIGTILPPLLALRLGIFASLGLYQGMWRFTGMRDLISLVKAVTFSSGLVVAMLFLVFRLEEYPRSVFLIDWFVVLVLVGGCRFTYRLYHEGMLKPGNTPCEATRKVLIVGAGRAGEMLLREISGNYRLNYTLVGFVDDDRRSGT